MAPSPQRFPSTQEEANKALLESDVVPARRNLSGEPTVVYAPYATENTDTSDYVGVNPEYMTYASDTEKPLRADGGVEGELEEVVFSNVPVVGGVAPTASDADTTSAGSGASSDLVYTATSGEAYSAVKAEPAEVEVTEEESESEPVEVVVPKTPTAQPTQTPVVPANTEETPTDAPGTPVAEEDGAKVAAKGAGKAAPKS